jgi:hypothetical protein
VHFEVFGEDRIKANPCQIDDLVTVSFDIESREFNGKWYTSIRAWKIQQGIIEATPAPAPVVEEHAGNIQQFDNAASMDDSTDLPF